MIEPEGPLSLSRQCVLLGVSRSSLYYRPKGERAENLALMRRMDELHMDYPFYGSRQMMRHLRREGVTAGRHLRRLMAVMGMEATYRRPRTSVANSEHRIFPSCCISPGMCGARTSPISQCQGFFYLAVMDGPPCFPGCRLVRMPGRRAGPGDSGDPEYRGLPVHQRGLRRPGADLRAWRSRWTAGAGSSTTSSSNGCGGR